MSQGVHLTVGADSDSFEVVVGMIGGLIAGIVGVLYLDPWWVGLMVAVAVGSMASMNWMILIPIKVIAVALVWPAILLSAYVQDTLQVYSLWFDIVIIGLPGYIAIMLTYAGLRNSYTDMKRARHITRPHN